MSGNISFDCEASYILENDEVLLRPLTMDDFHLLTPFSVNEPELWTYSLISAAGLDNLKEYMEIALKARNEHTAYPWLVFDKRTNSCAGSTRFYDIQVHHRTTQLGYTWYGKEFQRTGLNKQCKLLLLQSAFEEMGFDRVEFRADLRNERSKAAMRSIGCVEEGVLRSNCTSPSGRRDSIVFSILKSEWFGNVKADLCAKINKASRPELN